ncbi:MAG: choice-of-anchor Q domain-containing protein [Burkholderiaceae bacterium]
MKRVHFLFSVLVSVLLLSTSVNLSAQKRLIVKPSYTGTAVDTFATIKLAVAAAGTVSGVADTVIVYDGTYKEKISFSRYSSPGNRSLVLASRFILDGDTNHIKNTVISGGGIVQSSQNDILVSAYGDNRNTEWFQFVGFTIDSASKYGLYLEGGQVANCILKNSGATAYIPYLFQGTRIINSKIYNNIGPAIFAFSQIGSDANSPMWKVENSFFYNNKALSSNSERDDRGGPWNQQYIGAVIWSTNSTKGRLSNNIFYKNNGDNIISSGGDRTTDTLDVFNNVFYKNNTKTAYFMNWWGQFGQNNYTSRWYNNIIDNNYTSATNNTNSEFAWGDGGSNGKPNEYYFKNNLIATEFNTNKGQTSNFSTTFTFNYDTATQIIGVAQFKDAVNGDFSLLPTSPGIGAGNVNFSTTKDYLGNNRPNPVRSGIDMGAVESILAMPTPAITSLQNAVIGGKKAIKINFSIYNNPKVDSVIIYRSTASKDTVTILSSSGTYSKTNRKDTLLNNTSVFTDTSSLVNATKYYYTIKSFIKSGLLTSEASKLDRITTRTATSKVSIPTS